MMNKTATPPPNAIYPAISIIIPLYNAEKYIGECLDSLLAQTFQNFEVIVVDDCSTDNSVAVVESYAEKFGGRLSISCTLRNNGHGAFSRNKGLNFSRGEYIFNMDNDDLLTKTALEEMYTLAKDFDADVVYCESHYDADIDGSNPRLHCRQRGAIDKPILFSENLAERVAFILQRDIWGTPWSKLVSRKLLIENDIRFQNVCPCDDHLWTLELLFFAKKFLRVPNATYIWRNNQNSILRHKKTPQQDMNLWLNSAILGLKGLDTRLNKLDFFRQNPQARFDILNYFLTKMAWLSLKSRRRLSSFEIYEAIKQEFGEALNEQDVLVPALVVLMDRIDKEAIAGRERIKQLESKIQELENKLNLQELENELKGLI